MISRPAKKILSTSGIYFSCINLMNKRFLVFKRIGFTNDFLNSWCWLTTSIMKIWEIARYRCNILHQHTDDEWWNRGHSCDERRDWWVLFFVLNLKALTNLRTNQEFQLMISRVTHLQQSQQFCLDLKVCVLMWEMHKWQVFRPSAIVFLFVSIIF